MNKQPNRGQSLVTQQDEPTGRDIGGSLTTKRLTGAQVKQLRDELGMSQQEFARFVGLPPGTVTSWERRASRELSASAAFLVGAFATKTATARVALQQAKDLIQRAAAQPVL